MSTHEALTQLLGDPSIWNDRDFSCLVYVEPKVPGWDRLQSHRVYYGPGCLRRPIYIDVMHMLFFAHLMPSELQGELPEGFNPKDWKWKSLPANSRDELWVTFWKDDPPERVREGVPVIELIQRILKRYPKLLKEAYRENRKHPLQGHCYVAAEALYHSTRDTLPEYKPFWARDDTEVVHWWLENYEGDQLDPTVEQYTERNRKPPYENGRRAGFLTKGPSKRTQVVLELLQFEREWAQEESAHP